MTDHSRRKAILFVLGTRPEAIKLAPLILQLKENPELQVTVCITGQHENMVYPILDLFAIKPDIDLKIMEKNQTLADITSSIIIKLDPIFKSNKFELAIVHGDTTTCLSATIAAFYNNVRVAHIEAGLRTGNTLAPWPEEMNRILVSRIAAYHFAPTTLSHQNLLDEGITPKNIFMTGNTGIDALKLVSNKLHKNESLVKSTYDTMQFINFEKRLILVTGHRRENFGSGLETICDAINELANDDRLEIVFPVHLNPNVRKPVMERLLGRSNIHLIDPLTYEHFVFLMNRAFLILTDSGGVQEEAPSLGKPVLLMRDETERPEGVTAGIVKLVGSRSDKITSNVRYLMENPDQYSKIARPSDIYGDGRASQKIAGILKDKLGS